MPLPEATIENLEKSALRDCWYDAPEDDLQSFCRGRWEKAYTEGVLDGKSLQSRDILATLHQQEIADAAQRAE